MGLALSRKLHEVIWIGDNIRIEVARIGHDSVRLNIEAPKHLNIVREELIQRDADNEKDFDSHGQN